MKTKTKISILFIFAVFFIQPVHGQRFLKNLREKVEERVEKKAEEKAEEKVDEAIDKQLDKLEEALEGNEEKSGDENPDASDRDAKQQQRMQNILKGMGMSGEPVPVADNYTFDHLVEMHIESYDKNGQKFITHINPENQNMDFEMISGNIGEPGQGMFIIDTQNNAILILGEEEGKKSGIVYGMGSFFESMGQTIEEEADLAETPETYLANPNVKKTGKTKTIAGFKCEEYIYSDENSESHIWITKDMKLNTRDFFSNLFKTSLYSQGIPWGYMMEATSTDKETGEKSFMQVKRVDENSNTRFSLNDYEITNLGAFTMPQTTGEEGNQ